jgi:hypothetical protein
MYGRVANLPRQRDNQASMTQEGAVRSAIASLPSREVGLGLRGASGGYIAPGSEGGVTGSAMLNGSQAMGAELEVIVDAGMNG